MDQIDDIVDRAIHYTERILSVAPHHYSAARDGLTTMRNNLTVGADDHPALLRLDAYLGELERRHPN